MANKSTESTSEEQPASELSEYEQARARNIEKNNARLRSLGLISLAEEKRSNDMAWGRQEVLSTNGGTDEEDEESPSSDEAYSDEEYTEDGNNFSKKKKKRKSSSALPPREGSRKSRRLRNLPTEYTAYILRDRDETAEARKERIKEERESLVSECREARLRAAVEVANAGVQMAGKNNPTATYEHCLMRVRTMTEKGLTNRVRTIERAAGKHCVVKMAIFKSCLQDEGMWELAKLASESLERLKALLPPP